MRPIITRILVMLSALLTTLAVQGALPVPDETQRRPRTDDSTFVANSRPVIFRVNRTEIMPHEERWVVDTLCPALRAMDKAIVVVGRSAASPEGPIDNNARLTVGRRDALLEILRREGIDTRRIVFDVITEDYALLVEMMRQAGDPDYELAARIVRENRGFDARTKILLMRERLLWRRILHEYYPRLRAVRVMLFDPTDGAAYNPAQVLKTIALPDEPLHPLPKPTAYIPTLKFERIPLPTMPRKYALREFMAVRTNLLEWGAYVPQYGMCPMPNVSVEFYPWHGHFTYGASFDCPWWIGNTTNHKYFELRNYQLETRYYFRSGDIAHNMPGEGAAFRGLYLQAYAHAFLYQIGFTARKGWIGEGVGAGLGVGYMLPLGHSGHWRLDFGVQAGYFVTKYDPFRYGCPVENVEDGKYYYDWPYEGSTFKKRQHRFTWLGPTRVWISLSYDLLYRKLKRGVGFKSVEKGVLW